LKIRFRKDEITEDHVLVMTDVDYYLDMDTYLGQGRPMLMYTVVPQSVECRKPDYYYRIGADDKVSYHVAGGGHYSHEIWDYDHDSLTAYKTHSDLFGRITSWFLSYIAWIADLRSIVCYDVEQLRLDKDGEHRIVLITPTFEVPAFLWNNITPMERRRYAQGKVVSVYNAVAGQVSVGLDSHPGEVTLDSSTLSALILRLKSKTTPFSIGDIEVFIGTKVADTKVAASLLYGVLRENMDLTFRPNVISTSTVPVNFRPIASQPLEDEKQKGMACTSPLVTNPALIPAGCHDTAEVAVRERVIKVANTKVPKPWLSGYADEFTARLVPNHCLGKGIPLTLDEVVADQDTPVRRARVKNAELRIGAYTLNSLKTFIKTEPYTNLNDPRVITTCTTESLLELSQFAKAFKRDILLPRRWYGPGLDPEETVKRLGEVCPTNHSIERDFSRMDGRNSKWVLDRLVAPAYMRWCCPDERPRLKHALAQVYRRRAVSSAGFAYDAGSGTRSGSAITTDVNTIPNAFVSYAALRLTGLSANEAWDNLGLYYGDDSVDNYRPGFVEASKTVTDELGMIAECEVSPPDQPVTFLARRFLCPASVVTSYCDVRRALPKLHLSTQSPKTITRELAAVNKALGYVVTDSRTPLVGHWARRVTDIVGTHRLDRMTRDETIRFSKAWPQDPSDDDSLADAVAADLGLTRAELEVRCGRISSAVGLDDFPVVWDNPFPVKCVALVAGDLKSPPTGSIKSNLVTSAPRCRVKAESQTSPSSSQSCTAGSDKSLNKRATPSPKGASRSSAPVTRDQKRRPPCSQDSPQPSSAPPQRPKPPPTQSGASSRPLPKGKATPGQQTKQQRNKRTTDETAPAQKRSGSGNQSEGVSSSPPAQASGSSSPVTPAGTTRSARRRRGGGRTAITSGVPISSDNTTPSVLLNAATVVPSTSAST